MATTVVDPVFVDTNVLVYVSRPTAPEHAAARAALAKLEASDCAI
jgi:predicted nucleic acid-binding protein